jgi:lipopolysaccharide exporter
VPKRLAGRADPWTGGPGSPEIATSDVESPEGPDSGQPKETLARAGVRGAMWQGLAQAVGKSVVLVTTIVLARLLSPEQYGLVALALVLMAYAEAIADAGVAQALIYLERSAESARAALMVAIVSGLAITSIAVLSADAIAAFFHHPDVAPLVRVLAISLLAASLGSVPEALLRRELRFQRLTAATVIRAVVTGGVTIGLAVAGQGAWSLAIGTASGSAGYATSCWALLPQRVPWQVWRAGRSQVRATIRYGAPVAGSTLLAKLIFDVDYLIVGRLLGAEALGFYTMAFRLPEFLILNVFFVLASVMFPLYTRARHDPKRLQRGYMKSLQIQSLYGVTAGAGLAVVAPVLVPLLFGEKWLPVVLPLTLLSVYAAARSLGAGANEVYKAVGRPGLSIRLSVVRLAILVPVLFLAARWGIEGVAWAQLGVAVMFAIAMQMVAASVMHLRYVELFRAVLPALTCGLGVVIVGVLGLLLPWPPLVSTAVIVVSAVALVYGVLRFAYPSLLREIISLIRR